MSSSWQQYQHNIAPYFWTWTPSSLISWFCRYLFLIDFIWVYHSYSVLADLFLIELILIPKHVGLRKENLEAAIQIRITSIHQFEPLHHHGEQLIAGIKIALVACEFDMGNYEIIVDGLGWEQLGYFEVMDEVFIFVIIVHHVEIDELIYLEVLLACKFADHQLRHLSARIETPIIVAELRIDEIYFILHD